MAGHNCEDLDAPITVQTAFQPPSGHTSNPKHAHDPMETQCNQS